MFNQTRISNACQKKSLVLCLKEICISLFSEKNFLHGHAGFPRTDFVLYHYFSCNRPSLIRLHAMTDQVAQLSLHVRNIGTFGW